jgi:hypothetical protein
MVKKRVEIAEVDIFDEKHDLEIRMERSWTTE